MILLRAALKGLAASYARLRPWSRSIGMGGCNASDHMVAIAGMRIDPFQHLLLPKPPSAWLWALAWVAVVAAIAITVLS